MLAGGLIAFTAALASYLVYLAIHPASWTVHQVDLHVYVAGGLIVRHVPPFYRPHLVAPLAVMVVLAARRLPPSPR